MTRRPPRSTRFPYTPLFRSRDREGRLLVATDQGLADELAAAAGMLMGKADGVAAVAVSGVATTPAPGGAWELVRDPRGDLFRGRSEEHTLNSSHANISYAVF